MGGINMIAIVSDSSIGLTKKEAAALGIHIVPMCYTLSAAGKTYYEKYIDTNVPLEQEGKSACKAYTTSQPSSSAFLKIFDELYDKGYEILCLTISSRLSGAYSSAKIAAKELDEKKIRIVDTRITVGGIRFLAECAKEFIAENKTLEETVIALKAERDKVGLAISVEDMEPLRLSGRLGFIRKSVSSILNIKPILIMQDGSLVSHSFAKGSRQQKEKLIDAIPKNAKKIIIHYLGSDSAAKELAVVLKNRFPDIVPHIAMAGPIFSIHLGTPALGIAWSTI